MQVEAGGGRARAIRVAAVAGHGDETHAGRAGELAHAHGHLVAVRPAGRLDVQEHDLRQARAPNHHGSGGVEIRMPTGEVVLAVRTRIE